MGPLRREWLATATQDQAFFQVALSHYAGNYGLAKAERDPMEAVRFRMEAMKIINERLGVVEIALTDGTLGTVASLASYEVGVDISSGSVHLADTQCKFAGYEWQSIKHSNAHERTREDGSFARWIARPEYQPIHKAFDVMV